MLTSQEEFGEEEFSLLRTASLTDGSNMSTCFSCREMVGDDASDLRLGCRCRVHLECFVAYLKSILRDRVTTSALEIGTETKGIHCPNYNKNPSLSECTYIGEDFYLVRLRDLIRVVEIDAKVNGKILGSSKESFTKEDLAKLKEWLEEESTVEGVENDVESIIEHTTKSCPKCNFRQSHFHGHACHAVVCGSCHAGRCYRCGNEVCACGQWHGFCKSVQGMADINDFIVLEPYPYDKRCGCAICFDCRPGNICHPSRVTHTACSFTFVPTCNHPHPPPL